MGNIQWFYRCRYFKVKNKIEDNKQICDEHFELVNQTLENAVAQAKDYTDASTTGAMTWKGVVETLDDLPMKDVKSGWFYTVKSENNTEYAWNGELWYNIGADINFSEIQESIRKNANDIFAKAPSSTKRWRWVEVGETEAKKCIHWQNGKVTDYDNDSLSITDYLPVSPKANIKTVVYGIFNTNYGQFGYAFYDENKNYISGGERFKGKPNNTNYPLEVVAPEGAAYFRTTFYTYETYLNPYLFVEETTTVSDYIKEDSEVAIIDEVKGLDNTVPTGKGIINYLKDNVVHLTGDETISGQKKFNQSLTIVDNISAGGGYSHNGDGSQINNDSKYLQTGKSIYNYAKNNLVHLTGDESIAGYKKFTNNVTGFGTTGRIQVGTDNNKGEFIDLVALGSTKNLHLYEYVNSDQWVFAETNNGNWTAKYFIDWTKTGQAAAIAKDSLCIPSGGSIYSWIASKDSNLMHRTDTETVKGVKTFCDTLYYADDSNLGGNQAKSIKESSFAIMTGKGIKSYLDSTNVYLTKAEYLALETKDPDTNYYIIEEA